MKKISQILIALIMSMAIVSCGNSSKKDGDANLNDKKVQLEKLKKEQEKNNLKIVKLQEELSKLDTSSSNPSKIKLVAIAPVVNKEFSHYI